MIEQALTDKTSNLFELYGPFVPYAIAALLLAIILTPLAAKLAFRIGALDLPSFLRGRGERNLETRINDQIHPLLGGLAMAGAILLTILISGQFGHLPAGIIVGAGIITLYAFLDDWKDLGVNWQLAGQLVAACVAVYSGVSIGNELSIAGQTIELANTAIPITAVYTFVFPAHIITVLWIMAVINFVNWVGGVDGLNNSVSAIAATMILITGVAAGVTEIAVLGLIASIIGANIGTGFYVYPPAKIFNGAVGEHLNGFLLAVSAISVGAKSPVALVVLGIPIIDALWVMLNRMWRARRRTWHPLKLLRASVDGDRTHLHHRLLDMGLSRKGVLLTEVAITIIFSAVALSMWNITGDWVPVVMAGASGFLLFVVLITTISKRRRERQERLVRIQPQVPERPQIKVIHSGDKRREEEKYVY